MDINKEALIKKIINIAVNAKRDKDLIGNIDNKLEQLVT